MSLLWGWVPAPETWLSTRAGHDSQSVVRGMGRALRVHDGQASAHWSLAGVSIGLLDAPGDQPTENQYAPASTSDGRIHLWMAGEAFAGGGLVDVPSAEHTRSLDFRRALLAALLRLGPDAIAHLDGEYQIALWDTRLRVLTLINDRFGGLPLYWARSRQGVAFAGGVRGVLMAPGVSAAIDPEAIREAVTFGGFRLGSRTNVAAVKMVPGASVVTARGGEVSFRRYWRWAEIPPQPRGPLGQLIEQGQHRWRAAIRRRLDGAVRPGQALSGGLDSRAILAEAAPRAPRWTAITYGVPGCDDARYAERAADALGVRWVFYALYGGRDPDWLDHRASYVQQTDGLIELVDLMHLEALPCQRELLDLNLSGYMGDAVVAPKYDRISSALDLLPTLPFYMTRVGLGLPEAVARAEAMIAAVAPAPARFARFDHKQPQSTNRWTAAWRPWLRVRKPFLDYAFFDFFQGLPADVRVDLKFRERWLRSCYPACFARIPNQNTGVPVLTPEWLVQLERVRRFTWRRIQPPLRRLGLKVTPRLRYYHADELFWREAAARARIEETILRPGSLSCEVLGRDAVRSVVSDWFDRLAAPTQVIGALYVFEAYHRDLAAHLRAARADESVVRLSPPSDSTASPHARRLRRSCP